jgi:hypothetical protein
MNNVPNARAIVTGAAKENDKATLTYPYHEFFFVTEGDVKLSIHGGKSFTLKKGDFICLHKGTTVDFEFGDNFANVACFMDDERVTLIWMVKWRDFAVSNLIQRIFCDCHQINLLIQLYCFCWKSLHPVFVFMLLFSGHLSADFRFIEVTLPKL